MNGLASMKKAIIVGRKREKITVSHDGTDSQRAVPTVNARVRTSERMRSSVTSGRGDCACGHCPAANDAATPATGQLYLLPYRYATANMPVRSFTFIGIHIAPIFIP